MSIWLTSLRSRNYLLYIFRTSTTDAREAEQLTRRTRRGRKLNRRRADYRRNRFHNIKTNTERRVGYPSRVENQP